MKNKLLYAVFSTAFFSCAISNNIKQTSELALNVKFPQKFSIKAMPEATQEIHIKVSGVDLDIPRVQNVTRENSGRVIFPALPIGEKTIEVTGLDKEGHIITKAFTKNITIEAGKVVTENIELFGLPQKFNFENYPESADLAILEIKGSSIEGNPIYKEFKAKTLELDHLAAGDYDIRVAVFDKNAFPLGNAKEHIKLDGKEKTITLSNEIQLPKTPSVIENNLLSIPKELFDTLNRILIQVPEPYNHQPSYAPPTLSVNGVEQKDLPTNRENPLCLKKGDTLKVSVKTSDEEKNDKVSIFWGVTSIKKDNSISFQLLNDHSNELSYTPDFKDGTSNSLGFLLTDRKSYVFPVVEGTNIPFSIYFKVCE